MAQYAVASGVTHSRRLLVAIERLLTDTGIARESFVGYGVGLGPGSFTGLRIGMATVKGLAAAAQKPLYGVATLDLIAAGCGPVDMPVCAVLDARKKEVYAAFYHLDQYGSAHRQSEIVVLPPEQLAEQISEPTLMVGDALFVYRQLWQQRLGELVRFAPVQCWSPSAAILGLMAGELAEQNGSLDVARAVPLYVRASDAELSLKSPSPRA